MTTALIRGRDAVWGIATESGDTYAAGIIVDQDKTKDAEKAYIFDDEGFTISQVFFDHNDQCNINIICETATTEPDCGDDIQIVGIDCIVQNCKVAWKQKDWKMLNVTAKKFANLVEA